MKWNLVKKGLVTAVMVSSLCMPPAALAGARENFCSSMGQLARSSYTLKENGIPIELAKAVLVQTLEKEYRHGVLSLELKKTLEGLAFSIVEAAYKTNTSKSEFRRAVELICIHSMYK